MRQTLLRLRRRALRAFRPGRIERQLDDELRFHIESEVAAKVRGGLSTDEARRQALAEMGGVDRWREEVRDQRPAHGLELLLRDIRLAGRSLWRSPAYSLPAVATLALGIAALAAIASLTSAVLLRPLPYREPGRLVALWERNVQRNRNRNVVSAVVFDAWRARSRTLESITGFMPSSQVWQGGGTPERVLGVAVSPTMFDVLGRRPALGPGFSAGTPVAEVVVSHGFWMRRLGGDSSIIGHPIRLGATSPIVVGVMPNDFTPVRFGWIGDQEFWLPLNITADHRSWGRFLVVAGRLRAGVTLAAANDELLSIATQLHGDEAVGEGWDAIAIGLAEDMTGRVEPALLALVIAALLLLAMVVTNTSLLTLAYLRQRAPDRALRAALGATGSRLRGERLIASALLALTGAVVGALLGAFAIPLLVHLLPADVPRLDTVRFDAVALEAIGAATLIVALVLALLPSNGATGGRGLAAQSVRLTRSGHSAWLVVAEAAFALVLAVFASLTVRSFDRLRSVDVGFDPSGLLAARVALDGPNAQTAGPPALVFDRLLEQVRSIPGVTVAGLTSVRPFGDGGSSTSIAPFGAGEVDRSTLPTAEVRIVDRGYFDALTLKAKAGQLFSGREVRGAQAQAVVNEAFVRTLWGGATDAVGRKFDFWMFDNQAPEIMGIVPDVRLVNPRSPPRPTVYLSAAQFPSEALDLLVRTSADAAVVLPAIRRAVEAAAPGTPIYRVAQVDAMVADSMARERVTALLLGFFASAALLLVAVGVYGLFAGEVARGRQEIGIRMALGESAARLVRSMLSRALLRVLLGIAIGGVASLLATRALRTLLYGILPTDPLSHLAAIVVVIVAALGATLIPALQAARVDPVRALRAD